MGDPGHWLCPTIDFLILRIDWPARSLHPPVVSLGSTCDHAEHARRRRTWTRGFSPAALKEYEEIVNSRVVQLTETLSARKSVDLARMFGCFSWVEITSGRKSAR